MRKREFIKKAGILGIGATMSDKLYFEMIGKYAEVPAGELAKSEDFWLEIRKEYRLNPDIINLENGYYNIIPEPTLDKFIRHVRDVNYQGSYYMRTVQTDNKKAMAAKLSAIAGCPADELILTRNTTESLDIIIGGYPWKEGDEAVMAEQDYPSMLSMFRQVGNRYGVVNRIVSIPHDPRSDDEIVNLYANAITAKTKLLMVCHMINITGQILPVRKICDMAHSRGVEVMVDGAHTFGHIRFTIPELGCDYFGSSLHKWMSVPLGAGILWMKKEHIGRIWPLMAPFEDKPGDISRLNHTGTLPVHTDLTVEDAVEYYLKLGPERKEARLRYLQHYWSDKVRNLPHIEMYTPSDPARSCGIATVGVKNMKPAEMADILFKKYKIYTAPVDGAGVHGCRITPNVFTTTEELDVLVRALKEFK
ncbi:MAG: aminotransferase class V-fold PLP-dependent enzyme [Bacteroidales bacterium]|nr:aminotransferase class V-fold PLP-dependent enzyme [Bacteroidales bacterium]